MDRIRDDFGIVLVPVGETALDPGIFDWLEAELERRLGVRPGRAPRVRLRPEWLDLERGQFRSNAIVDALIADGPGRVASPVVWALAVTDADLYAPGRPFVFGEATLGGAWSLISLARLAPSVPEPAVLRARALTEALHELGHLAGISHCDRTACAMAPSASAGDVDRKSPDFCARCVEAFRGAIGLDPTRPRG